MNENRFKLLATCQENTLAESSQNHTPSVQLGFIVTGAIMPQHEKYIGAQVRADLWLTQDCADRTFETIEKCFGWSGDDISEIHTNRHLFADHKVVLVCEIEEYQGREHLRVAFVNPISRVFSMKKEKVGELAPALNSALQRFRKNTKEARRTVADLANSPAQGESVPF
jgi:hypothetical protein